MRSQRSVRLVQPAKKLKEVPRAKDSWEGVDRGLFESLRLLRRIIAEERGVPPFVIFGDATLRELARVRPGSPDAFLAVRGVGRRKLTELGPRFIAHIREYCRANRLTVDMGSGTHLPSKW
jgi:ATP-dependent DNA helicase RecQ